MLLALVQMKIEEKNRKGNIEHGLNMLKAVKSDADIAVLPEVWTTGYSLGALKKEAEDENSELFQALSSVAREKDMAIVAGSVPFRRNDGKVYNTTFVFDKQGKIIADYDKIHMFSLYDEEKFFRAGNRRVQFQLDNLNAGLAICYDLRFPELFRAMAINRAQVAFIPAEWPAVRGHAYRLLTQARAIESQIYMCAVNCTGKFRDDEFYGHSMLVAPTGDIIVEGTSNEEILYGTIDIGLVAKVRSSLSVLKDVREELYRL